MRGISRKVERVARVISKEQVGGDPDHEDGFGGKMWQLEISSARAAIREIEKIEAEAKDIALERVQALVDAMLQLLDDMGTGGLSVCLAAKAQARVAFEPFAEPEAMAGIMSLADAERIADLQ